MPQLSAHWPFSPKSTPFFYGWVIWLLSTLGVLFSIPGQTMGMAVFTDAFIDGLGLTRTELSMAYLVGTVGSS
ncbi:MAG: OFA family oxalate/formate antiporter-like MFS transporter, partial [Candidatus Azotimanducaceae bacterium]